MERTLLTKSKQNERRYRFTTNANNILRLLLAAFMGYQIGWCRKLLQLPQQRQQQTRTLDERHTPATDDSDDTLHRLARIASTARSNSVNEVELPYSCGVVFFYHIPCTGGSTINHYLLEQSIERNGTSEYFTFWGDPRAKVSWDRNQAADALTKRAEEVQRNFINGMDKLVQNISMNEWRIAHAHHNSFHLNESESVLSNWRSVVESNGCHFVASVMFRDALIHSLALHKYQEGNISREEWVDHLHTNDQLSLYRYDTQLDYFLYSKITRNQHAVDAQVKVDRALQLLARHFDIVAVGGHEKFKHRMQQFTGWEDKEMPRRNSHEGTLNFTKKEVENIQKLLEENGDINFMEKVKLLFVDNPVISL